MANARVDTMCAWIECTLTVVAAVATLAVFLSASIWIIWIEVSNNDPPQVTVSLVDARGLDADEQARTTPAEFGVAIGFLHLTRPLAVGHDGGHVAISYAGVKLAEGHVPKFFIAGGRKKHVEATRVVASAGKDQAPLSQMFRDHLWVDQQLHGEAAFDVALSFYDVNAVTGKTTRSYHNCKVGLPLHGKAKSAGRLNF